MRPHAAKGIEPMRDHDDHDDQIEGNDTSAKETGGHDLDGWTVYDAAGEKLGRVIGGARDGKYFTLEKGQLFTETGTGSPAPSGWGGMRRRQWAGLTYISAPRLPII
jgi:hypothetical protein